MGPGSPRWTRRLAAPLALVALVLVFYGPHLGRYFTSEDFLLIRFLEANPPWNEGLAAWTGPWLGVTVVKFYRPVATLLYALEIAAFGANPVGYNLVHTLVHAANAVLIFFLVGRLSRRFGVEDSIVPVATAALFALYPLHPNAVLFSASFATLFGALFFFAAFLAWQRFRDGEGWAWWVASLAGFLAALGSYEAAAVFPALLMAYDHLAPASLGGAASLSREAGEGRGGGLRRHLAQAPAYLPFFGFLGLYFLFRRSIFGVFVGGYEEYSQQLQSLVQAWRQRLGDLATSIVKLHAPEYERWPGLGEAVGWSAGIVLIPFLLLFLARRRLGGGPLRAWLFAWAWTLITQAPFAFRSSVPGNGRYWYLAALGVALSLAILAQAIAELLPRRLRPLPAAALLVFSLYWGGLLKGMLRVYQEAGETTRRIQSELIQVGTVRPGAPATLHLFLTRYPFFLENHVPVPLAQVYHYGLRDSVNPPFARETLPVYPLPPLAGTELLPVALAEPRSKIFAWDPTTRTVQPVTVPSATGLEELEVVGPAPGTVLEGDPASLNVELRPVDPGRHPRLRLIVLTRANAIVADMPPSPAGGAVRAPLPAESLLSMHRLYGGGDFFWWVEARDGSGALTGFTRMRSFRLDVRPGYGRPSARRRPAPAGPPG